ncbi:MAG: CotH kinase family protein [Flavobacteriales bacterium]|nr:CotH kinase family protein [Flavobacteriales bacterium]MBP7408904.1 CotH kinase family protein [Flavobacteriales bacterium]
MRIIATVTGITLVAVTSAQVVINEVCSRNATVWEAPDGSHPDWIELYNASASSVQLQQFFLSDKPSEPGLWQLPALLLGAGEFVVLYSDNTAGFPFGIDGQGETIVLSDADLAPLQTVDVPRLDSDHSYGSGASFGSGPYFFDAPTPGAANTSTTYLGYAPTPVFNKPAGYTQQGTSVSASAVDGTVRWTWNGRTPDGSSPIASAITVDSTMVLQARTYRDQWLPSQVAVSSYVVSSQRDLPIISLSVDPDSMFHPDLGMYVTGPNADTAWPYYGANYWAERSLPAHVEFFEANGTRGLMQKLDVQIHGGRRSRVNPQRPLRLTAQARYGNDMMTYPFFPERDGVDKFKTLVLRNSGSDFCISNFRDGLWHQVSLHNDLDIDELAFRPAIAYVNGTYWGLVEIRERIDNDHLHNNYGADRDDVLMMEEENWSMQGDTIHFWNLMEHIRTQDMNDPANWAYVDSLFDLKSAKDYFALEMYAGNVDWPGNNLKYWKPSITEGKWRYMLYDLDGTMEIYGWIPQDINMFDWTFVHGAEFVHSKLLRGLLTNSEFKRTYLNRLADLMNTSLGAASLQAEVDRIMAAYDGEIERHFDRWDCWFQFYLDHAFGIIPHFAQVRSGYVRQHVLDQYGFPNSPLLEFDVFPPAAGTILLNTIAPELPFRGYYFNGNDIDVTVEPNDGFTFDHWAYSEDPLTTRELHWKRSFPADGKVTAYFRPTDGGAALYPNPATNDVVLGLDAASDGMADVRISDVRGRLLATYQQAVTIGINRLELDVAGLQAGTYLITSDVNGDRRTTRFVKD